MPIVTQCTAPGCKTRTIGHLCVQHDLPVTRDFVRGRPFTRKPVFDWRYTSASATLTAPNLRRGSERAVAGRSLR